MNLSETSLWRHYMPHTKSATSRTKLSRRLLFWCSCSSTLFSRKQQPTQPITSDPYRRQWISPKLFSFLCGKINCAIQYGDFCNLNKIVISETRHHCGIEKKYPATCNKVNWSRFKANYSHQILLKLDFNRDKRIEEKYIQALLNPMGIKKEKFTNRKGKKEEIWAQFGDEETFPPETNLNWSIQAWNTKRESNRTNPKFPFPAQYQQSGSFASEREKKNGKFNTKSQSDRKEKKSRGQNLSALHLPERQPKSKPKQGGQRRRNAIMVRR